MKKFLPLLLMSFVVTAAQADNFRCGKWVARPEMTVSELVAKCGEPDSREKRTEELYGRNVGGGTYKTGSVSVIETWIYNRGTTASPMVVTIVDGKIESIERKE